MAAPIFRDFMKGALAEAPPTPFRVAPGIEEVPIDWKSGNPVPAGHARRHHGSLQGRHRAGRSQCAPAIWRDGSDRRHFRRRGTAPGTGGNPSRAHRRRGHRWTLREMRSLRSVPAPYIAAAMRPEIARAADDIQQAIALLRRHL